jgi:carotenoid cleavage dioxygenase-like enzyme
MAAVTLSAWSAKATTLSASNGTAQQFILPARTQRLKISSTAAIQYSFSGTDGAAIGSDVISLPTSAMPHTMDLGGRDVIYIASSTNSAVVQLMAMT